MSNRLQEKKTGILALSFLTAKPGECGVFALVLIV
jgi:hypothetical protein